MPGCDHSERVISTPATEVAGDDRVPTRARGAGRAPRPGRASLPGAAGPSRVRERPSANCGRRASQTRARERRASRAGEAKASGTAAGQAKVRATPSQAQAAAGLAAAETKLAAAETKGAGGSELTDDERAELRPPARGGRAAPKQPGGSPGGTGPAPAQWLAGPGRGSAHRRRAACSRRSRWWPCGPPTRSPTPTATSRTSDPLVHEPAVQRALTDEITARSHPAEREGADQPGGGRAVAEGA